MKGINNRQKMVVRARESVDKGHMAIEKLRKDLKRGKHGFGTKNSPPMHRTKNQRN